MEQPETIWNLLKHPKTTKNHLLFEWNHLKPLGIFKKSKHGGAIRRMWRSFVNIFASIGPNQAQKLNVPQSS